MIAQLAPEQKDFALTLGAAAAVVWGIAVSLYSFGPRQIDWGQYMVALIGGIAACLALPPLVVFARSWLRLHRFRHD